MISRGFKNIPVGILFSVKEFKKGNTISATTPPISKAIRAIKTDSLTN
jgi:hypothetical protein